MFARPQYRKPRFTNPQASATGFLLTLLIVVVGCGREDPRLSKFRQEFILDAAPPQATSIADAKAALAKHATVVFEGRVGPGPDHVFTPGKAAFLVAEILPAGHSHPPGHDASDCPFCKRRASQASLAAVQFVDASGEVLPIDARNLFGLKTGDSVVIRGRGEILKGLDLFRVTANGIYLKPEDL